MKTLILTTSVVSALTLSVGCTLAAPPPVGSDDWKIMSPFKDWVSGQKQPTGSNGSCCDWADGRPVEAEIRGDHWWAHVTPAHWPGIADQWLEVPDERVIRAKNPVGAAILWIQVPHEWVGSHSYMSSVEGPVDNTRRPFIYCFSPPDGS